MHLHLEARNTRRSDCCIQSLSWMGKVPETVPDDEGWKLNRTTYYQEGWLATGNTEGQVGVTFTACHCKKNYEAPPRTNFNLRGHQTQVSLVRWNEPYQKLATCDVTGVIYVWIKHEGRWSIELINDRSSQVLDFAWSHDGRMALIVYCDGFVLVGSVFGQRFWSTMVNVQGIKVTCGVWAPDDQEVLLGTRGGQMICISSTGVVQSKTSMDATQEISAMLWSCEKFNLNEEGGAGKGSSNAQSDDVISLEEDGGRVGVVGENQTNANGAESKHVLAVSCKSGDIYLLDTHDSVNPIIIKTALSGLQIDWTNDGKYLAVGGFIRLPNLECKNELRIYTRTGALKCRLPFNKDEKPLASLTWGHNDRRLFVAIGYHICTVWVAKKSAPLQFLCHRSIESCLSHESLTRKLPLPSKLRASIATLFVPTIKGHIPQPTRLCEFVCLPPPPTERLYCTIMKQGDDEGGNYILYLEYLGGLIPLLKGKRTSKLKPEFVVFDPKMQTGRKHKVHLVADEEEAGQLLGSSDSDLDPGDAAPPTSGGSTRMSFSPRRVGRKRNERKPRAREKQGPATEDLLYCKELSTAKKLLAVTSNIWGTKFRISGLASYLPEELGAVSYKTSLLHLQPRQMTVSIAKLKRAHRKKSSVRILKTEHVDTTSSVRAICESSFNILHSIESSKTECDTTMDLSASRAPPTSLVPVFPSSVPLPQSTKPQQDIIAPRQNEGRFSEPVGGTRRTSGRHKSNSLSPAFCPMIVRTHEDGSTQQICKGTNASSFELALEGSGGNIERPCRCDVREVDENDPEMLRQKRTENIMPIQTPVISKPSLTFTDKDLKLGDSASGHCPRHSRSCLPLKCETPPLSPTQIYTCDIASCAANSPFNWTEEQTDELRNNTDISGVNCEKEQKRTGFRELSGAVDSGDTAVSIAPYKPHEPQRSNSVPSNKAYSLLQPDTVRANMPTLSLSQLESHGALTQVLSLPEATISSSKRLVLSRLTVPCDEFRGKDTPVHKYSVRSRGSGIEVLIDDVSGSTNSLDSLCSVSSCSTYSRAPSTGCFNSPANSPCFSRKFPFIKRAGSEKRSAENTKKRERASSATRLDENNAKRRELSATPSIVSASEPASPVYRPRATANNVAKLLSEASASSKLRYPITRKLRRDSFSVESSEDETSFTDLGTPNKATTAAAAPDQYLNLATFQKAQLNKKMRRARRKSLQGKESDSGRSPGVSPSRNAGGDERDPPGRGNTAQVTPRRGRGLKRNTPSKSPRSPTQPVLVTDGEPVMMHNKAPLWNENSQVYQLDFGGRVTQESAKNFQIEHQGQQVMQFGRIDTHTYTLDFQFPFTCAQAFAVALANVTQRLK